MSGTDDFLAGEEDDTDEEFVESEVREVPSETTAQAEARENTVIRPVDNIGEIAEMYEQFDEVKKQLLKNEDVTPIGDNLHVNKSGWRKIATAFNLSVEVQGHPTIQTDDGVVHVTVQARTRADNGKTATATGTCSSNESNFMETLKEGQGDWNTEDEDVMKVDGKWRRLRNPREVNRHNLIATAETRAKNRAISDLVGGGEVSAEELGFDLTEAAKEDVFG